MQSTSGGIASRRLPCTIIALCPRKSQGSILVRRTTKLLGDVHRSVIANIMDLGGPKVEMFNRLRDTKGDKAVVRYLAGAVSGFGVTPLGACTSNFLTEPCPRHVECFRGCEHMVRTGRPEEARGSGSFRSSRKPPGPGGGGDTQSTGTSPQPWLGEPARACQVADRCDPRLS
ncbi:hypothetical protein GGD56_006788 [Rhizobium mongolense]|uniref:Uncharacterized protein n=1 Tax=Rhizobium mongolense TaxID=57676 RepID=A0ABR6IYA9_9HYPH|nr:hypothetical protein [Rhizobium mongolense]